MRARSNGSDGLRWLVTGGAGFIGSHFVRTLLDGTAEDPPQAVTVLDSLTYAGDRRNLAPVARDARLRFLHGDVSDPEAVEEAIEGVDVVVHFAAESHVDRSIVGAADFVRTNVTGTQVLLEAARSRPLRRFVQVSTDEVYGSIAQGSWTEDTPLAPNSPYSASKAGADLLALAYHRTHGVPVCVTRGSNTYGPYQFPEKVVPLFVTRLLEGRTVPLYGTGENVRDWLHVDDHCAGVRLVATGGRPGRVYHVGGGLEMTNRELTAELLAATGADWSSVERVADRPGHDLRYSLDCTRIRDELGYAPRTGFRQGLLATVRWYEQHRERWQPLSAAG